MTLCLNECLRAVGLQHHYARFTSMGIHRAVHLSVLTIEDYPILGIRTMEDRTRLFQLVQMIKTLDLESLGYEDVDDYDDYVAEGGGDEGYNVVDRSFTYDGHEGPDEDVYDDEDEKGSAANKRNAATFARPSSVRRRLDFNCDTTDHHQKLISHPIGSVHVCASHNRNDEPGQGKGSARHLQLELDKGSAVVCSCKGSDHRTDAHRRPSDHHPEGHTKPDIMAGTAMYNSYIRLSPKCVPFHKNRPRTATVVSKRFNNKPAWHKDRKRISKKENLRTEKGSNVASSCMAKPPPIYESNRTVGYNYGLPRSSPSAPNKKQEGEHRINVCVRKRPLTRAESRRGEADVLTTSGGTCVIVHESKEAVDLTEYIRQHRFYFDQVFGEESSNEEVYQRTAYPLVQHMLNGGKATCFAYGQTGAGKTHTMLGSSSGRPGLYALAVRDIFAHMSTTHLHSTLLVYVSFFEIYCGQLYDLLDHRKRLFAREDGQRVVHIAGLRDVRVDSVSSLLEVISQGTDERTQGVSGVNPFSSRSHALLRIQLRGPNQQIAGRMWFVDLAGSERASDTKEPDRQSRMEGAEINQSLLALKECIRSLDQEQAHTPFRQSKLTQVLKDSFVGDSKTCMIANISPGHLATEHTLNTLRYADRVKELKGHGGLRGRRCKTIPSPKNNLSSSSSSSSGGSSVGTRGKSPPKKQKLGRLREAIGPNTPNTMFPTEDVILCSTPKDTRWETESARGRKGIGLEHITPVRGWLGMRSKRHEREDAGERKGRRRENERHGQTNSHSVGDQYTRSGLELEQPTDEQLHLWELQKSLTQTESGIYHGEKENGKKEKERRWRQQQRQGESSRGTCSHVETLRERDLQKADEKDEEKQKHLRRYHQQLQQFIPSSASSSVNHFSHSSCPSSYFSNQVSISSSGSPSSCSSLRNSSHLSASALMCHGLEDVYRARVEVRADGIGGQLPFPNSEMRLQDETSLNCSNTYREDANSGSGGVGEDWRVSWKGTEARFGQDGGQRDKRRTGEATGEPRVRREDRKPAGMEGGERKWAWVAMTETKQKDRVTGAAPANVKAQASYSCHSDNRNHAGEEGLVPSDVPAEVVWRTEGERDVNSYGLVSTHTNNESTMTFVSAHQRAPAERPLSPACEHINILLTPGQLTDPSLESKHMRCVSDTLPLPLENTKFSNSPSATQLPVSTSVTQVEYRIPDEPSNKLPESPSYTQLQNHLEAKANMSVFPQDKIHADSLSSIMDPLSISLLQVDQQVATSSCLHGEKNNTLRSVLKNERGEDNRRELEEEHHTRAEMASNSVEDEDVEFCLSRLVLPQTKTQTSVTQSFVCSDHRSSNTDPPSSHNLIPSGPMQMAEEYAHNMHNKPASSISTPQSERILGQSHTVHLNHSSYSNNSFQPNSPAEPDGEEHTSNQQIQPIIQLSALDDLGHAQLHVVQAHWKQLEEMEALCHKEGALLCQQPDMAFGEYVHKLEEIMERKAWCVHSMRTQLQPYLKPSHSNQPHNQ